MRRRGRKERKKEKLPTGMTFGKGMLDAAGATLAVARVPSQTRCARQLSQRESQVWRIHDRYPIVVLNEGKNLQGCEERQVGDSSLCSE